MALGLDATAHPSNGGNLTGSVNAAVASPATVATPVFSTGAGPILFVALVGVDSITALPGTIVNTSGLTWTKRAAFVDSTNSFGGEIWTAYSATGVLSTQTVTFTLSNLTPGLTTFWLAVQVITGVPGSEAACIGNSNGFIDETGVSTTVNVAVTPAGTGSWLIGHFGQANDTTVLVADGNTSAWDAQFITTHTDNFAFGRYKSGGAVALTTAGTPVTFGSSTADLFGFAVALEIKAASLGAIFVEDDTFVPARMMSFAPVPAPQWNMGEQEIVPQPAALAFEEDRLEQVRMQPLARVPAVAQDNEDAPALFAPWIDGDYAALALMPPAQTWRQTPPVREDDFIPPATGPFEDDFWTLPIRQAAPLIRGIAPSDEDMPPTAPATLQPDEDFWVNMVRPLAGAPWRDPVQRNNEDTPAGLHGPFEEDRWTSGVAPVVGTPWRNPAFIADEDYIRFIASVPNLANLKLLSVGQAGVKLTESASATARLGLTNSASLKLVRKLT